MTTITRRRKPNSRDTFLSLGPLKPHQILKTVEVIRLRDSHRMRINMKDLGTAEFPDHDYELYYPEEEDRPNLVRAAPTSKYDEEGLQNLTFEELTKLPEGQRVLVQRQAKVRNKRELIKLILDDRARVKAAEDAALEAAYAPEPEPEPEPKAAPKVEAEEAKPEAESPTRSRRARTRSSSSSSSSEE